MAKAKQLAKPDLERLQRYAAERTKTATALKAAQEAFSAAERRYQGLLSVLEAEYEYDPVRDEIGEDGAILAGAATPQAQEARELLRRRRERRDVPVFDVRT